jgi:hypothetical protein
LWSETANTVDITLGNLGRLSRGNHLANHQKLTCPKFLNLCAHYRHDLAKYTVGICLAAGHALFQLFFLPRYHTFTIPDPQNWSVNRVFHYGTAFERASLKIGGGAANSELSSDFSWTASIRLAEHTPVSRDRSTLKCATTFIIGERSCTQADRLLIFGASVAEFDVQQKPADSGRIITNYNLLRDQHLSRVLPARLAEGSSATDAPATLGSSPKSPRTCIKALQFSN